VARAGRSATRCGGRSCVEFQAVWKRASGRAGERGGALAGRPRWVRIFAISSASSMAAMIFMLPPALRAVFEVQIEQTLEQARPAHARRRVVRVFA